MKFVHLAELQQLSEANKPLLAKVKELGKAGGLEDSDLEGMIDAKQIGKNIYVISKDTYEPGQFIMNIFHVSKDGKSGDWGGTPMDEYKSKKDALAALAALKEGKCDHVGHWQPIPSDSKAAKAGDKWKCFNCGETQKETPAEMNENLITEVQVRLKPKTRVKALDHFGSETENPQGHKDIKNAMKFLDIDSLAKDKLHSIDAEADAADFKKHARNLGFKELEYPGNNDAKLAGFERVGVKNGTTFWKKGNALLVLGDSPMFMIKDGGKLSEMREGPDVQDLDDDIEFEAVDFKADPSEVLDTVDKQLKSFGLEVVTHETDGDDYAWSISKIGQKVGESKLVEGSGGLQRSVENWMDVNKAYSFEGPRGVRNLTKLAGALGYSSLDDFLEDNSGAIEAVVEWIGSQNVPEWKEKLKA